MYDSMKGKKIYGYDIIRALACIMVVILHSPKPGEIAGQYGIFLSALSYLTAPCIPLFFMLSGALLLVPDINPKEFIKKRFGKFIFPVIIWSFIYLFNKVVIGKITTADYFFKCVLSIPFSAQEGVLWFMYTLSGLYLLVPILSPWLKSASKKIVVLYLCIWSVTLCYPYLENLLNLHTLVTAHDDIFYYFTGYVGYFVLGWFLRKYSIQSDKYYGDKRLLILSVACLVMIFLKGIDKILHLGFDEQDGFGFQSLAVAVLSVFWWYACIALSHKKIFNSLYVRRGINTIAKYSFGIYLSHILIMRPWLWDCAFISNIHNYILQTFTIIVCDFGLSLLLCVAISYMPYSKYIIAYHQKNGAE